MKQTNARGLFDLVNKDPMAFFGNLSLLRVLDDGSIVMITEKDEDPSEKLPAGTDITEIASWDGEVKLVSNGRIDDEVASAIMRLVPVEDKMYKVWRMNGEDTGFVYLTGVANRLTHDYVETSNLKGAKVVFNDFGNPVVGGFTADGKFVRREVQLTPWMPG